MTFPVFIYLVVWISGFACSASTCAWWIRIFVSRGWVDDPGHRKIHSTPMPLAGGVTVLTGLILPLCFGMLLVWLGWLPEDLSESLDYGFRTRSLQLTALIIGGLAMVVLGIIDDRYELGAASKFTGQFLIALGVASSGMRITLFVDSPLFSYAITILWILTMTNAMNFMDNMNGLCGGLGAIAASFFGLSAAVRGHYLVASIAFLSSGAMAGFLPFNYPRARTFLGDSGSHLVGFLMATLAILPHFYSENTPRLRELLDPLWILLVPLTDLIWVVLIRWKNGMPFYKGDTNHLSHRLVANGLSKVAAVAVIWFMGLVAGLVALL